MKKLMTLLSAATVALGLYAYDDTGTSFDKAPNGAFDIATADDYPFNESGNTGLWATNGVLELTVVSNAQGEVQHLTDMFTALGSGAPADDQHLVVKSTFGNTLTRKIKSSGTQDINDGLYFDSTVKFTAFDQDPTNIAAIATEFADNETKIAVWVQTSEDESATNLYVRAGRLSRVNGELTVSSETYKCNTIRNVDAWHRLTIKAISDLYSSVETVPGFIVYLDGAPCGRDDAHDDAGVEPGKLNPIYEQWIGTNSIFPSLVQGRDGMSLSSATFDGQGELDDIVFTEKAPSFAKDTEIVTVAWTPGEVTGLTIAGVAQDAATLEAGHTNLIFVGSSTDPMQVAVTGVTYAEDKCGVSSTNFVFTASGVTETIASESAAVSFAGTGYATVAEAVGAAVVSTTAGAVLRLFSTTDADNIDLTGAAAAITIDLNGQTMGGITADNAAWIIDSTTNSVNVFGSGVVKGQVDLSAASQIDAGTFDEMVSLAEGSLITGGRFSDTLNSVESLAAFAPQGYRFVDDGEYIVLEEGGGTVFTVTLTWDANETPVLYQINEYTPVDISGATSPLVISDVGSGTNVSFIVANADGAKKGYAVKVAGADAAIDATGATFGWPEYLGAAVDGAYQIDDANDLVMLQKGMISGLATANETFKQTANIDMTGVTDFYGIGWFKSSDSYASLPTGLASAATDLPFAGTYDGQGYTISNVRLVRHNYAGVFNCVEGTVKNLTVENLGFVDTSAGEWGCGIVGNAQGNAILEFLTAATSAQNGFWGDNAPHNTAGIAARAEDSATIRYCVNNADITASAKRLGGIISFTGTAGAASDVVSIIGCTNNGAIYSSNGTRGVGGIIASPESATAGSMTLIKDCANFGTLTAGSSGFTGAIVGSMGVNVNSTWQDDGGNTFLASANLIGTRGSNTKAVVGLAYAIDAGIDGANYLTTVKAADLAAGNTYVLLTDIAAGTVFTLQAAGDTIAFDANGHTFAGTVDGAAAVGVSSATAGTVTTYTAFAAVAQIEGGAKYATLQDAVDAAQAGDTVTVLADCTIATSLSIAKNITVHNDYTIAATVNYAICIGATVSFEGTGKIERASGISGSPFCVGANETTRGAITAGTAGTLNFDGLTVCGGSGGNLIKLENGTVNMNGGVLKDGLRGIKADADAGSYTSTIVINGGTITNCSGCAVMASAESAGGTATVTINGGEICGVLDAKTGASGQNGIHTITIPSTSTAKFDRDQTAFCAPGYATTLSDGWYVVGPASYTITYLNPDGTEFTNFIAGVQIKMTYDVTEDVELPTAVHMNVVGVEFDGWTNATGQVYGWLAGTKTGDQTFYAKLDPVVPPVTETYDAGSSTTFATEQEATIEASMINANRSTRITVPTGISDENGAYTGLFYAYASGNTVTIGFTEEAAGDQATNVTANAVKQVPVAAVAAAGASGTVEANLTGLTPGVWYSVLSRSTLAANVNEAWVESTRVMADSTGAAELVVPNKGNAGFYKVAANPADNSNSND